MAIQIKAAYENGLRWNESAGCPILSRSWRKGGHHGPQRPKGPCLKLANQVHSLMQIGLVKPSHSRKCSLYPPFAKTAKGGHPLYTVPRKSGPPAFF
jgi:hypothetical protein